MKKYKRYSFFTNWQIKGLLLLIVGMFISHVVYVYLCRQYPVWDENHYMSLAVGFYDLFHKPLWQINEEILTLSGLRQPLYGFILSLPLLIIGTAYAYKVSLIINGLLYIATIIGVYLLARMFVSKTTSLLASCFYAWYGNVLFYLHYTYSETAVSMLMIWFVVYLLRANLFLDKKNTLVAAIFFALATLTRWITPALLALLLFVYMVIAIYQMIIVPKNRTDRIINIAIFIGVAIVVPLILYFVPNWQPFIDYINRNRQYGPEWVAQFKYAEMANPISARSLMFYFNIISQNTIFLFVPFIIGFLYAIIRFKRYFPLLCFFCGGYGFLTLFAIWKEDRFIVPLYPVIAVISVIWIDRIGKKYFRKMLILMLVIISFCSFLASSWGIGPMGKRGLIDVVLPSFIHHPRRIYLTPLIWKPNVEYVNAHIIREVLQNNYNNKKIVLIKTFKYEPLDNALLAMFLYEWRNKVTVIDVNGLDQLLFSLKNEPYQDANYILTSELPSNNEIGQFRLIQSIPIPANRTMMYLFTKNEK